jgi:hypothetical protein
LHGLAYSKAGLRHQGESRLLVSLSRLGQRIGWGGGEAGQGFRLCRRTTGGGKPVITNQLLTPRPLERLLGRDDRPACGLVGILLVP